MGIQTTTHSRGAVRNDTPSDSVSLEFGTCRAIRAGGAGDISIVDLTGATVIIPSILAGETLPAQATRINATGTTATLITVLY
jgi:hypothetical protein